jgi:predicted DNA-binding transcriptional regulator AlpA
MEIIQDRLLRLPEVLERVPVGRSTWWKWVKNGHAPSPVKIGPRTTAWRESDLNAFITSPPESTESPEA